ncbi:MAG: hypothetical protein J7619_23085 [Dyadobacter sp.]|uniref:hypothetical protein n=1 Tax=Dyadobacter sp. TaxID=1914288 RepID=UPI001B03855A|nr:hypothetical protein [Dyadobacter sp.]MBO9615600.1 hypothetical protein [Dyadobacter sp.]
MKKLFFLIAFLLMISCKKRVEVIPVQRTLNGTVWKKYELRSGDRDVHKVLTFRAPNIINIAVRDDHGYLFADFQKEYTYIYEHPNFTVFAPNNLPDFGRLMNEETIEFNGEIFLKSK